MLKVSDNFRGAALMMASMAAYVLNDTLAILVSDSLGIFQVMFSCAVCEDDARAAAGDRGKSGGCALEKPKKLIAEKRIFR